MEALEGLERLLARLEGGAAADETAGDAIDAVNASPPRTTATRRLREAEVMQRFRAEMAEGLVRSDTVKGVFDLLGQVLDTVLTGRS